MPQSRYPQFPQFHPLEMVHFAVPFKIQEFLARTAAGTFGFEDVKRIAAELDLILERADSLLLYKGAGTKEGEVAAAFNKLVEGLAALSFVTGGVPFKGLRYDARLPFPYCRKEE